MKYKKSPKKDWHNPPPENVGYIISEIIADNGRKKAVIVKNNQGNFYMYGYLIDDSDFISGYSDVIGWVSYGPSITDALEKANQLAEEFLSKY